MVWSIPTDSTAGDISDRELPSSPNAGPSRIPDQDPWGIGSAASNLSLDLFSNDEEPSSPNKYVFASGSGDTQTQLTIAPVDNLPTPRPIKKQRLKSESVVVLVDGESSDDEVCGDGTQSPRLPRYDTVTLSTTRRLICPKFTKGTEWWALPLWESIASFIARLPEQPVRPVRFESFCGGCCAEAFGMEAPWGLVESFSIG
jgi:hypothetical protein